MTTPVAIGDRVTATPVRGELANLDTLRTYAVLCVLFDHLMMTVNYLYLHSEVFDQFIRRLGRLGVIAFFVHTSLVLMFSLERLHRESPRPTLAFYLRRAFRIYPLSILIVIAAAIFQFPDQPFTTSLPGRYSTVNVVSNLLLLQNFVGFTVTGPLWSLPFEVQMYMVLPPIFLVARRPDSTRTILGWIAGFAIFGTAVYVATSKLHFLAFIPCFLSGVMAYSLRNRQRPRIAAVWWALAVPALLLACALGGTLWPRWEYLFGYLLAFCLGSSVYLFHDSATPVWNTVTKTVAKYSYGLYLLHIPSLWLVFKIFGVTGPIAAPALWALIVAVASVAMFHLVEDPLIRYGKKVTRKVAGGFKSRATVSA